MTGFHRIFPTAPTVYVLPPNTRNLDAIAQVLADERGEPLVEVRSYDSALRMDAIGWPDAVWRGEVRP